MRSLILVPAICTIMNKRTVEGKQMRPLESGTNYSFGWLDDAETVMCLEITGKWSWDEASDVLLRVNDIIAATPRNVYSILHFKSSYYLPQSGSVAPLRRLIAIDNPNELLTILVNTNHFLTRLTHTVSSAYGLGRLFGKYRFTPSLEDALRVIEADRQRVMTAAGAASVPPLAVLPASLAADDLPPR